MVPTDTVKQRRQLSARSYTGNIHCLRVIMQSEGTHDAINAVQRMIEIVFVSRTYLTRDTISAPRISLRN